LSQAALNLAEGEGNLIVLSEVPLLADPRGALYWPEHRLLAVADLHLEKGSSFAARGQMLPPYDTATTLACLSVLIADYSPRCVVSLGDSFHDGGGPTRLSDKDRDTLTRLQRGRDWIWITGNHDPEPAEGIGGVFQETLKIEALTFRHLPKGGSGEVSGHLHPGISLSGGSRQSLHFPCFYFTKKYAVLPAFSAFSGHCMIRPRKGENVFAIVNNSIVQIQ